MNPFIAFCLYVAARVFVQYLKSRSSDQTVRSSLQFLLMAMQALKRKNPLTESFLVQLEVDLVGAGMPMPPSTGDSGCSGLLGKSQIGFKNFALDLNASANNQGEIPYSSPKSLNLSIRASQSPASAALARNRDNVINNDSAVHPPTTSDASYNFPGLSPSQYQQASQPTSRNPQRSQGGLPEGGSGPSASRYGVYDHPELSDNLLGQDSMNTDVQSEGATSIVEQLTPSTISNNTTSQHSYPSSTMDETRQSNGKDNSESPNVAFSPTGYLAGMPQFGMSSSNPNNPNSATFTGFPTPGKENDSSSFPLSTDWQYSNSSATGLNPLGFPSENWDQILEGMPWEGAIGRGWEGAG